MKYSVYAEYKDSGVEWLGEVPGHWRVLPLKSLFNIIYRYPTYYDISYVCEGVPEIRGEAICSDGTVIKLQDERYIDDETNNKFPRTILHAGDIVMSVRGTMGKVALIDHRYDGANITANLLRLSPNENATGRYLLKLFMSEYFLNCLDKFSPQTTIKTITIPQLTQIILPIPSIEEQQSIADFLDTKTTLIDDLIAKKEKQIELLKEKRTAIINRAVTKGLNPNVPMKDSGIEWLGEIPAHWEIKRLKHLISSLNSGVSVNSTDAPVEDETTFGVLKTSCVYGDVFRFNENKQIWDEENSRVSCPVTKNSIIISRMNTPMLVGSCGYVDKDYPNLFLPDRLWLTEFRPEYNRYVKFMWYQLTISRIKSILSVIATGTSDSMKNITQGDFVSIEVLVPNIEEQEAIVRHIDKSISDIEFILNRLQMQIEKLREYRQSLISVAVTGKIDVREKVHAS